MKILHWNCQGLRNPLTVHHLQVIRRFNSPDIMFLVETKNNVSYVQEVATSLGYPHHRCIAAEGSRGGMAMFWDHHVQFTNRPVFSSPL